MPIIAPAEPSFARAVAGNASMTVTWGPSPASGITHYVVRVFSTTASSPGPSDWTHVGSDHVTGASDRSLKIGSLTNGRKHYAAVWAEIPDPDLGVIDGVGNNTNVVTPSSLSAPDAPKNVVAKAGDKTLVVSWGKPASNGGSAITSYVIKLYNVTDDKFVKQNNVGSNVFSTKFTALLNDTAYYVKVYAVNRIGTSGAAASGNVVPTTPPPILNITVTGVSPDKQANMRPGQSQADAPTLVVAGTNLDQAWGADSMTTLEWVLYTSTSWSTVVGSGGTPLVVASAAQSLTLSSPLAPGNADVDADLLIGPWRLKVTYVPDQSAPNTATTTYSPAFYTTSVGSVTVGTVDPNPVHDNDIVTVTGPDVGICTVAYVDIGGNTQAVAVTRVDQNTVTLVLPSFGYQLAAAGTIQLQYTLNGNVLTTEPFSVMYDTIILSGGDSTYVPPTPAPIATGDYGFPLVIHRWTFTDPATGNSYVWPRNPDHMTSPFKSRNIQTKYTTALGRGKVLLIEGAPSLAQWQFGGIVKDAAMYEQLRFWVEEIDGRVIVEDHFGRQIECVLTSFDAKPHNDSRRYWSHDYTITAIVLNVGAPTEVPA